MKNKTDFEINHEAMKNWNNQRAVNEQKGLDRFRTLLSDPILHPNKKDHKSCPSCNSANIHYDISVWVCKDCSYEWGSK